LIPRPQLIPLLVAAILGGVLLFAAPLRAADPTPLDCPNGQTVYLEGRTIPREALLVYLKGRAVGGGLADSGGAFRLPLRADERPGSYPVEVRLRASGAVVARFTCFVDIPIDGVSPTPAPPAAATPTPAPSQTAGPARDATATPGRTTSVTATGATATGATATAGTRSPTPTGPTATASTTRTAGPSPTRTTTAATNGTAAAQANEVAITYVVLLDPAFPDELVEYVEIENNSDREIPITGWQLRNASRSNVAPYVFPQFVLEVDAIIAVYSNADVNDLEVGDFYWGQSPPLWQVGDRAELRDRGGNLISSYVVVEE
jgi:hypothetical protein